MSGILLSCGVRSTSAGSGGYRKDILCRSKAPHRMTCEGIK